MQTDPEKKGGVIEIMIKTWILSDLDDMIFADEGEWQPSQRESLTEVTTPQRVAFLFSHGF